MKHDVVRFDTPEDGGVPCDSIIQAIAEPPLSAEATVEDRRGLALAVAVEIGRDEDNRPLHAWVTTGLGHQRIYAEAHGETWRVAS